MPDIVIRLEVPQDAAPPVMAAIRQFLELVVPAIESTGGTGALLVDGQPIDEL